MAAGEVHGVDGVGGISGTDLMLPGIGMWSVVSREVLHFRPKTSEVLCFPGLSYIFTNSR